MTEQSEHTDRRKYPRVTGLPVDICIFTVSTERRVRPAVNVDKRTLRSHPRRSLEVVLVMRSESPFRYRWALPGGFTRLDTETLEQAAIREVKEETNLDTFVWEPGRSGERTEFTGIHLEQFKAYYKSDRDPRGYTPTVAFAALVNEYYLAPLQYGSDALQARLFRIHWLETGDVSLECTSSDGQNIVSVSSVDLAFDHAQILRDALQFIQSRMMTTTVAATLLPEEFTIEELHQVIAAVVPSYAPSSSNFARDLLKTKSRDGMLEVAQNADGSLKKSVQYSARPAQLYRFRPGFEPRLSIYPRF